ncbi:ECF transporter S component [Mycoplasma iguanae]|uniref:ECF transporter S component n=1 Tax=Mycoplasma iguanae TaxID=292461 RepID=A0ABY5R8X7_9MOLU|nr:ECF transporter S component [Mycoplasma iguanae]UVD81948.1 ECF transporter S component [Mycoplasma iguanae]
MITIKQKWNNYLVKHLRFSIFDVAIAGIFLALFLIIEFISKTTITGRWALSFEIGFYILFGIVLGPFKGVFLSLISDTFSLLIFGRIGFWMIEYAIVPPFITLVAWIFFKIYLSKHKFKIFLPHITLFITVIIFYSFFIPFASNPSLVNRVEKREEISIWTIYIIATSFFIFSFIFILVNFLLFNKYKKQYLLNLIYIFSIIVLIMIVVRWLWNPYAFIVYYNRFITRGSQRTVQAYYVYYLIPAILKSIIIIPIYTIALSTILPAIFHLNKKYTSYRKHKYKK